jgi:hypothetical protein
MIPTPALINLDGVSDFLSRLRLVIADSIMVSKVITKTIRVRVYKTRPWVYKSDRFPCTFWVCRTHCPCIRLTKYKTIELIQF